MPEKAVDRVRHAHSLLFSLSVSGYRYRQDLNLQFDLRSRVTSPYERQLSITTGSSTTGARGVSRGMVRC